MQQNSTLNSYDLAPYSPEKGAGLTGKSEDKNARVTTSTHIPEFDNEIIYVLTGHGKRPPGPTRHPKKGNKNPGHKGGDKNRPGKSGPGGGPGRTSGKRPGSGPRQ